MKKLLYPFVVLALMACGEKQQAPIDREALVDRNSPQVTAFDSLASLSVGNGRFADIPRNVYEGGAVGNTKPMGLA